MWTQSVVFSGLFLAITSGPLFLAGHRVRVSHWGWSQLMILITSATAWLLQRALVGPALPFVETIVTILVIGSVITAWCDDWSPPAHANFTAVIATVSTFLAYAMYVLIEAHLGFASLLFGAVLLLLQSFVLLLLIAHTFDILDVVCRTRWHRKLGAHIVQDYRPRVSIHVPTHNEPPELVMETLDALARLDYDCFEVLVLDNNTQDEALWRPVEAHCRHLGRRFRFFHLMPWPGYKSGALNFALDQIAPDTEIIGIVDADYVVEPNYLKELVGHFSDPGIAFVQTPQDYRDAADRGRYGRALYLSYQYFFGVSMPSRNERNAIIFAGTMGLIRRAALQQVGGWDEWCITEDAEVSFRLLKAGYRSVYVDKTYGRGLMPLDYAGLKKQRFRWAFGGMQLLRLHAPAVFVGRSTSGQLTVAQRYAYLSGGLQWLNDPVTFAFTVVLMIAASALIVGGSLYVQPLVGGTILVPPLLIWFGMMRFLWALRVRCRCTYREAMDAFVILLGLTWVVTLACVQGLTARHGVFLRTPKQADRPTLRDAAKVVWLEGMVAAICVTALAVTITHHPSPLLSARTVLLVMLAWQALIYGSAACSSFWNYQSYHSAPRAFPREALQNTSPWAKFSGEFRLANWVSVAIGGFGALFWVAVLLAPSLERVWRSDPLRRFISAETLLPSTAEASVGGQLIREADAARRQDVDAAVALWDPHGLIRDYAFTPDAAEDDRIWRGIDEVRTRYRQEFQARHYRLLRHFNLTVTFNGSDEATVVNDLDAVIESNRQTDHVLLNKTDRWTLRRTGNRWRIVMLEINRTARPSAVKSGDPLFATRRHE